MFSGSSEILHQMLAASLAPLERGAIINPNGDAVFIHSKVPVDLATLPQTAALCHRYLKLNDGDVALTNDPYSGGSCLSEFTLVRGLRLYKNSPNIDFLIVSRIAHSPKLPFSARLDEEGVRVPPTPLVIDAQFNRDLLHAIAGHPLAPKTLFESIATELERMERTATTLKHLAADPGTLLSPPGIRAYFEDSQRVFEAFASRLPLGNATVSTQLKTGELIKLQLRISEERIVFDFAGTDSSTRIGLTDLATFGACWASLTKSLDAELPLNAGTFQGVQVSAPTKTLLSAAAPTGTTQGMIELVPALIQLVNQALGHLRPSVLVAPAPTCNGCYHFSFEAGHQFTLWPTPGQGARVDTAGTDAWPFFRVTSNGSSAGTSAESLETHSGIEVLSVGPRKGSGGNGKNRGGQGASLAFRFTEPCELFWHDSSLGHKHVGLKGGRPGAPAEIEVILAGKPREKFTEMTGRLSFKQGDSLYILSGGGGGFGEAADNATEKDE